MAEKKWSPRDSGEDGLKLTQADIYAMRTEFFTKVTDPELRRRILTIAFAYGDDTKMPHATDMMAWYLAQPENRHMIDQLALEYMGYTPEEAEMSGEGGGAGRSAAPPEDRGYFPVPNGITWAIASQHLAMRSDDSTSVSFDYAQARDTGGDEHSRPHRVQVLIPARDQYGTTLEVAGEQSNGGWTSIVVRTVHGDELNLVFYDGIDFARLLDEACGGSSDDRDNDTGIEEESVPPSRVFRDAIIAAGREDRIKTREDAVLALATIASVWRACWTAGEIGPIDPDGSMGHEGLRMSFYRDAGTTLRLLENGMYLPQGGRLDRLDAIVASALTELLAMTATIAFGYDINKRNYEAIEEHVARLPEAKNLYPDWVFRT